MKEKSEKLTIRLDKLREGRLLTMNGCGCAVGQIIDQLTPRGHKLRVRKALGKALCLLAHHIDFFQKEVPALHKALIEAGVIENDYYNTGFYMRSTTTQLIYSSSDTLATTLRLQRGMKADEWVKETTNRHIRYLAADLDALKREVEVVR